MKNFKEKIAVLIRMLKAHSAPNELALGVAVGVFIAILPLYGLHTVLCLIAMVLIRRANKLAILLGTNISLPPTVATITWTAYDIGRLILINKNYPPLSWEYFKNFKIERISEFYYPLFLGSLVLGVLCAGISYLVTLAISDYLRKKRHLEK